MLSESQLAGSSESLHWGDMQNQFGSIFRITASSGIWAGADGPTRTDDPRITNALLYQLSYAGPCVLKLLGRLPLFGNQVLQKWCRDPESNWGHADFQSAALPAELSRHLFKVGSPNRPGLPTF